MKSHFIFVLRLLAAAILLQTLYFKFTGAPESKYIFALLGIEPWGRIASGVIELISGIFLLLPATQILGATIAVCVMVGAILSHIFVLGVVVQGDGGSLFALAFVVLLASILILVLQPNKVRATLSYLRGGRQ